MSKNILIINSSYRKKNTYNVLMQIEQLLKKNDTNIEIINLFDYKIENCIGCKKCITDGECCFKDDMINLMIKMVKSDGLILSSPIYVGTVSGKFKTMVDRTCMWYHRPELAGKPILFVATTEATGIKDTKKCFETIAMEWGVQKAGFIARSSRNINSSVKDKELIQFLKLLNEGKSSYKPSIYEINIFQVQKVLALKTNERDKQFWQDSGWIDKVYYYTCKVNLLKRIFSNLIFKFLYKVID
jgi:multimeric flavodoxin WrbA